MAWQINARHVTADATQLEKRVLLKMRVGVGVDGVAGNIC
jgi:hypothetical protein